MRSIKAKQALSTIAVIDAMDNPEQAETALVHSESSNPITRILTPSPSRPDQVSTEKDETSHEALITQSELYSSDSNKSSPVSRSSSLDSTTQDPTSTHSPSIGSNSNLSSTEAVKEDPSPEIQTNSL
ncbi:MAG: hypothetical protein QM752_00880 [Gammaproteobacteria bacterium]